MYRYVLNQPLDAQICGVRAKRRQNIPVVLTENEVISLLGLLSGLPKLMALLCYGAGLRKMGCRRLRVKDADFDRNEITVRQGKGNKERTSPNLCLNLYQNKTEKS